MAYRGGYGSYFNGRSSGGDVDPLAAAIGAFSGGWKESNDRRRAVEAQAFEQAQSVEAQNRANEAQRLNREQFEEQKRQAVADELRRGVERQDRLNEQRRAEAIAKGQSLMDAGFVQMPNLATGGLTLMRGPSKSEREDATYIRRQTEVAKLLQGQKDEGDIRDLRGAAAAVGIKGAETMSAGELRQRVKMADEARENAARMREIGARSGPTSSGRAVPSSVATSLGAYDAIARAAGDAVSSMKTATDAGVNVTGPGMGLVAGVLEKFKRADTRGTSARGALANVASEVMKQRSGGAITPQEFERLEPFLPSKFDDEATAQQKLNDLAAHMQRVADSQMGALEDAGYDTSRFRTRWGRKGSALDELDTLGVPR